MNLTQVPAEYYLHLAKIIPMPEMAFGMCGDDLPDVILVYKADTESVISNAPLEGRD